MPAMTTGVKWEDNAGLDRSQLCGFMMQLARAKPLRVSRSGVHGWGAFLQAPARRGDLVYEYRKELVMEDEAEDRGQMHDRNGHSFLFNLHDVMAPAWRAR